MEQNQKHYYAFISHSSEDEKNAKWLCKQLEGYRIPAVIQKEYHAPKRLKPIFLFQKDLSGNKLPDVLEGELSDSQFLIVICSPAAAKSDYVNKEVKHFIDSGRYDKIIPFIIEGTPYARKKGDLENECFPPALVALKGTKQELRGIDFRQEQKDRGSKKAAVIDVIASMLGVRMDVLWDRYKRRIQKIRNAVMALLTLLLLIIMGIYDYTRTKVEYYADWVDCNGVAQGVIPLSDEQYSHRYASYKFEYTRVPFGEKGFYSWRLNKVSLVNSKGVVSSFVPDKHPFPIQEYKYTDGYVTEIINRDTYNRVVMRYIIKDDYDHKVACLVDMEGKEKHQGSAYLGSSTTAFISDATQNMSKIKRFHYTRNGKGYITKVTYHANDADELEESAIGDNNNIYGKRFDLDEFGRVTKVTYINHEGNPMTDKYGVGYIKYNNASFENNDTVEYIGSDGELAYNEHRFARQINKLDKYGNPVESFNEGADGKPCYDYKNIYRQVVDFDENGCFTEIKYYDFDGNSSYCSENYAIQRRKYDSKGRWVEVAHYDVNDKPCYTKNNYSITRVQYDKNDCIIEQSFYDIDGRPCVEKVYGLYCIKINYDEYNYIVEQSIWGTNNEPAISSSYGFHLQKNEYDDYHRLIRCISYDSNGNRCINTQEYCCEGRYTYDTRGNLVKIECLDTDGKPCVCKDGYAIITYKYDNYGNCTEVSYYGINNEPIYINMCASVQYDYYPNGLVKEERYYNEKGELCLNNNWYAISRYEWNNNGLQTKVSFFDTDTVPCYYKDGLYSCMEFLYDNSGNIIKEIFYDSKGNTSLMTKGLYAIAEYKFDNYRHIIEYSYFNEKGQPCYYDKDYHILRVKYDLRGNVTQHSIYGVDGKPTLSREGSSIIEYKYDSKNNIIRTDFKDITGKNVNQESSGYSTETLSYNERNLLESRTYFDKNGALCQKKDFNNDMYLLDYSRIEYRFDSKGNIVEYLYYNTKGKLTSASWSARIIVNYDMRNRMIQRRYYDKLGHLTPGPKYQKAIEIYDYNDYNQINKICLLNSDSTFFVNHYYLYDAKGRVISSENRDESGNLKIVHVPYFGRVPYAVLKMEWDDYGNLLSHNYYDGTGNLMNTDDGYSTEKWEYDVLGHLISDKLFDNFGKATCSKTQGWHKSIGKYNSKGLIEEIIYYDEKDRYVNVYTSNANGGCKIVYKYNEKGEVLTTKLYESKGGTLCEVQDRISDNYSTIERKADGSLVIGVVQMPGSFQDKGYNGNYFIIELNDWCIYNDLNKFGEILVSTAEKERHFLMVTWEEQNGAYKLGKLIDDTFPAGTLGVRFMDVQDNNDIFNTLVDIYEAYKHSNKQ